MNINIILDRGAIKPTKAHDTDAGFDLYNPGTHTVKAYESIVIDTGVHMEIPRGYVGMIKSKSGLNVKHNLTAEGVIDCGYTGTIQVKIYNNGNDAYTFRKCDKITQLVILPIPEVNLIQVKSFEETERGAGGFGSTGR